MSLRFSLMVFHQNIILKLGKQILLSVIYLTFASYSFSQNKDFIQFDNGINETFCLCNDSIYILNSNYIKVTDKLNRNLKKKSLDDVYLISCYKNKLLKFKKNEGYYLNNRFLIGINLVKDRIFAKYFLEAKSGGFIVGYSEDVLEVFDSLFSSKGFINLQEFGSNKKENSLRKAAGINIYDIKSYKDSTIFIATNNGIYIINNYNLINNAEIIQLFPDQNVFSLVIKNDSLLYTGNDHLGVIELNSKNSYRIFLCNTYLMKNLIMYDSSFMFASLDKIYKLNFSGDLSILSNFQSKNGNSYIRKILRDSLHKMFYVMTENDFMFLPDSITQYADFACDITNLCSINELEIKGSGNMNRVFRTEKGQKFKISYDMLENSPDGLTILSGDKDVLYSKKLIGKGNISEIVSNHDEIRIVIDSGKKKSNSGWVLKINCIFF